MTQATFTGRHGGTSFRRIYLAIGAAALVAGGAILAHPWSGSSTSETTGGAYLTSWQRPAGTANSDVASQIEAARIDHDNAFPLSAVLTTPSREVDGSAARAEHDTHIDAWLAGAL